MRCKQSGQQQSFFFAGFPVHNLTLGLTTSAAVRKQPLKINIGHVDWGVLPLLFLRQLCYVASRKHGGAKASLRALPCYYLVNHLSFMTTTLPPGTGDVVKAAFNQDQDQTTQN